MVNSFCRAKELADILGIDSRTIRRAINKGTIKADFVLNRYQIPRDECIKFIRYAMRKSWQNLPEPEQIGRAKEILSNI